MPPFDVHAEVTANTRLSPDYNVLALAAPEIARAVAPGQFVMLKTTPGLDPLLRRPFSVFEVLRDAGGTPIGVSVLNKRVGVGTRQLLEAPPGSRIGCLGPLGRPFVPVDPPARAWMVAGGVGLAPFATLAEALASRGTTMTLFYGGRSSVDLYYTEFFERLGARLVLTTEDGTRGEPGRVTTPLARALAEDAAAGAPLRIYACGPTPMMRAVAALGADAGRDVFVSLEPVMGCGMGGCYSCVVRVRRPTGSAQDARAPEGARPDVHFVRSCLDGPVFDATVVVWNELGAGH
jgi:dihydroorotate dehydrogenase electron transfer subunit